MRTQTLLVSLLLLITVFFVQRAGLAQNLTTSTIITTVTTKSAQTESSYFTSATSYETTTVSSSVLDTTLSVSAPPGGRYCEISPVSFSGTAGITISGTITSDTDVHLYLLRNADYQAYWSTPNYCDPTDAGYSTLSNLGPGKSFNWQWTPPTTDTYWWLVENSGASTADVQFLLVSQPVATTVTNYVYATSEVTILSILTQTVTSDQAQPIVQATQAASVGTGDMTWVVVPVVIIVVLAIVGVLLVRFRRGSTSLGAKCPNCGARLPANARFCKKCGASQQSSA